MENIKEIIETNKEKVLNCKLYLLYEFKKKISNENNSLYQITNPGIQELLDDYIDIYNEINKDSNEKLIYAKNDLLESIKHFSQKCTIVKDEKYKREFEIIMEEIDKVIGNKDDKNENRLFRTIAAIKKKIEKDNIFELIINKINTILSFDNIDYIIDEIIGEALYEGYSIEYLSEWFNKNVFLKDANEDNIDIQLHKFVELKKEKEKIDIYISIKGLKIDYHKTINISNDICLTKIDPLRIGEELKFLSKDGDVVLYTCCILAQDIYKAMQVLYSKFNSYFEVLNFIEEAQPEILEHVVYSQKNVYNNLRYKYDFIDKMFKNIERKEKLDTLDFIKYRDAVLSSNINYEEALTLQRAINITRSNSTVLDENKLISTWTSIEYIVTFNNKTSIISNILNIVPKIISLYYVKEKINIFWNRFDKYKDYNEDIKNFRNSITKENNLDEYDLVKFLEYLKTHDEETADMMKFNMVLFREINQIGNLIENKNLIEYLKTKENDIRYDLIRIYRMRNKIIHSGKYQDDNISIKTLRLMKYANHLIALIIYYKRRNPNLTITEILNSIELTYQNHMTNIKGKKIDMYHICKPKYLFIE
jgi:uncharacterized tellurite resistance protein B-like protein